MRGMEVGWRTIGWLGRGILDALVPPLCLACRDPVQEPDGLCADCWSGLSFVGGAVCEVCGAPFAHPVPAGTRCGACLAAPPAYDRARAALDYAGTGRDLILAFKHADRPEGARLFSRLMAKAGGDLIPACDVIVPVPLHRWRLLRRRYNQAAILARGVARETGRPAHPDLLIRRRATQRQGGLGRTARTRNVQGAFALRSREETAVSGRRVLLVDDVLTTGATAGACARTLKAAGAAGVDVLVLARVTPWT